MKKKMHIPSILMAGLLCVGLALPAAAANNDANITISGSGKAYEAYQLMELTTSLKADVDHDAVGHEHGDSCYNYAYTINARYASALRAAAGAAADADADGQVTDEELLSYIGALENNGNDIRAFADALFKQVGNMEADETANNKLFTGVPQGYYLIAESELEDGTDSRSLVMLNTAGQRAIIVSSKEGVPTLAKQVYEESAPQNTKSEASGGAASGATQLTTILATTSPSSLPAHCLTISAVMRRTSTCSMIR